VEPDTDVYAVVEEHCIAVTPLTVNMNVTASRGLEELKSLATTAEKSILDLLASK
jgi:hypothetical protein